MKILLLAQYRLIVLDLSDIVRAYLELSLLVVIGGTTMIMESWDRLHIR